MAQKIDNSASAVATSALQALPFGQIIGSPLKACIDAQTEAALSTWNYINSVGIIKNEKTDQSEAVYVKFSYRSNGRSCSLSIPLLTLVPIPYLAIKDINIAFKANISAAASYGETNSSSFAVDAGIKAKAGFNIGVASASVEMAVNISSKKDSTATRDSKYSVEYTMDVNVSAGQDDMPAGMSKVLEILNNSIETIDNKGEISLSASELILEDGKANAYILYKNPDGYYEPKSIQVIGNGVNTAIKGNGIYATFESTGEFTVRIKDNNELSTIITVK